MTFWTQVGGDRRLGVADRDRRAGLEHRPGAAGVAVDEVLADQRLRPRVAGGVVWNLPKPAAGDLDRHHRVQRLLVQTDRLDRPGRHARDLEVGAGDQAERVVELDLVGAGGAALVEAPVAMKTKAPTATRSRPESRIRFICRSAPRTECTGSRSPGSRRAALHRARAAVALAGDQQALGAARCCRCRWCWCRCWCRCPLPRPEDAAEPAEAAERQHAAQRRIQERREDVQHAVLDRADADDRATRLVPPLASIVPGWE